MNIRTLEEETFFNLFLESDIKSIREFSVNRGVGNTFINRLPDLKSYNKDLYDRVISKSVDITLRKNSIANCGLDLSGLIGKTISRSEFMDWILGNYSGTKVMKFKCRDLITYASMQNVFIIDSFGYELEVAQ